MDHFKMMIEGAMAKMSEERRASAENMRLGAFIEALEKCEPSHPIVLDQGGSLNGFCSYRGYYEDLCVMPSDHDVFSVAQVLKEAREAVGERFTGYKGGDFWMTKNTILWVASYGDTGRKLIGVRPEESRVVIETAEDPS